MLVARPAPDTAERLAGGNRVPASLSRSSVRVPAGPSGRVHLRAARPWQQGQGALGRIRRAVAHRAARAAIGEGGLRSASDWAVQTLKAGVDAYRERGTPTKSASWGPLTRLCASRRLQLSRRAGPPPSQLGGVPRASTSPD